MRELEWILKNHDKDFKFHYLNNCIRCFPHIINICVSHIIASCTWVSKEYLKSLRSEDDDELLPSNIENNNDNADEDDNDDNDDNDDDDNVNDDNDVNDDDVDDVNDDDDDNDDNDDDDADDYANDYNYNYDNRVPFAQWDIPTLRLKNVKLDEQSASDQAWFVGMARDPVKRARRVVRILLSSDQRMQAFKKLIQDGNNNQWYQGIKIVVPEKTVLHDVKTQWDSTYKMIKHLLVLRPVSGG
jgi:hypothetical protein